jgi:hypothetical protein
MEELEVLSVARSVAYLAIQRSFPLARGYLRDTADPIPELLKRLVGDVKSTPGVA